MKVIEGNLVAQGSKFAVINGRFNSLITKQLLEGAVDGLQRHGVESDNIEIVWVPGAYELPLIAQKVAESGKYDGVICLGAVIRGSTPHFDYVCAEASKGIAQASMKTGVPIIFGVLTTDTIEQAIERAGTKAGNKGFDSALTAVEMVNLIKQI